MTDVTQQDTIYHTHHHLHLICLITWGLEHRSPHRMATGGWQYGVLGFCGVGPMVQAGDLLDFVKSRHRREAEEALVRRQEAEELAEYRRRHQEEMAQARPGGREQDTLSWKYCKWEGGG